MNVFYIPKDAQTYLSGILLLILTLFAAYFLTTFEEKPLDFLYCIILTVQTIIAFPSIFNPKGILLRLHYALFLIIPFWLTQIYSAYLFTFISQVLSEHQIATCSEIADQRFRLTGDLNIIDHIRVKDAVTIWTFNIFWYIKLILFTVFSGTNSELCHLCWYRWMLAASWIRRWFGGGDFSNTRRNFIFEAKYLLLRSITKHLRLFGSIFDSTWFSHENSICWCTW